MELGQGTAEEQGLVHIERGLVPGLVLDKVEVQAHKLVLDMVEVLERKLAGKRFARPLQELGLDRAVEPVQARVELELFRKAQVRERAQAVVRAHIHAQLLDKVEVVGLVQGLVLDKVEELAQVPDRAPAE